MTRFTEFFSTPKARGNPKIAEPPPSSIERKKKEESWFQSLRKENGSKATKNRVMGTYSESSITLTTDYQNKLNTNSDFMPEKHQIEEVKRKIEPMTTQDLNQQQDNIKSLNLATRLTNLSISHQEGLINDSEYRILRSAAFQPFVGNGDGHNLLKGNEPMNIVQKLGSAYSAKIVSPYHTREPPPPPPSQTTHLLPPTQDHLAPSSESIQSKSDRNSFLSIPHTILRRSSFLRSNSSSESKNSSKPVRENKNEGNKMERISNSSNSSQGENLNRVRSLRNYPNLQISPSHGHFRMNSNSSSIGDHQSQSQTNTSFQSSHYRQSSYRASKYGTTTSQSGISTTASIANRKFINPLPSSTDPFIFSKIDREPTIKELSEEIREITKEMEELNQTWIELENDLLRKQQQIGIYEEELIKVKKELINLREQKLSSQKKYQARIDYLQSRLRGAEIRAGIKK